MAKFGHVIISGLVWIVIAVGFGALGLWMVTLTGSLSILGIIIAVLGFGFVFLSISHLLRITYLQIRGMRMMRDDPEIFEEMRQKYKEAVKRQDEDASNH